jgi:hypothetical protein
MSSYTHLDADGNEIQSGVEYYIDMSLVNTTDLICHYRHRTHSTFTLNRNDNTVCYYYYEVDIVDPLPFVVYNNHLRPVIANRTTFQRYPANV